MVRWFTCGLLCVGFVMAQAHVIRCRTQRRTDRIAIANHAGRTLPARAASDRLGTETTRALSPSVEMAPAGLESQSSSGEASVQSRVDGTPARGAPRLAPFSTVRLI